MNPHFALKRAGRRTTLGTTLLSFAIWSTTLFLFTFNAYALVSDGEPFDPGRMPVELQAWWTPNFGHIHAGTRLPLGQVVSGTLNFDVRIVLHDNPSHLVELRIDDDGGVRKRIPLDLDCPYDGVTSTNCAFNVPVSLDTTQMQDGWRELRIRGTTDTPDGKRFLNSSGIPINVQNGGSDSNYNRWCNNTSLIGRSWYEGFGYTNAIIECVPLQPISGVHTFRVRAQQASEHLEVALDKTHFIPAVGPWPAQQPTLGEILFDADGDFGSFFPITIDTRNLSDGWHTLAVTSTGPNGGPSQCSYCQGEINKPKGVAKIWFFVQNGSSGGGGNTPPQINSGPTATPNPVAEDQTAQLSVTASDADANPLTYSWTVALGEGSIAGTGATVTYTPPDVSLQQTFTITVEVSDGQGGSATGTVGVTVLPMGGGGSQPPAPVTLFFDDFESGNPFANWTESNEFDWNIETPVEQSVPGSPSGNLVAHADICSSSVGCILTLSAPINLSRYGSATLSFWRFVDGSLDSGEFLKVEAFDGTSWKQLFFWGHGQGDNNTWQQEIFNLQDYMMVMDFRVRFVSKESRSSEETEIDDVWIQAVPFP